ncbi:hypothetical protein FIBSPDRAFT_953714 [Athelia psychrophila]|uniref:Uncharacterized protein n=1 Tax=Athelia psychrophila TaxID=1759441 RepID=A0A166K2K5_9AGAM|nr:hypothetical protein FIBSPDRAFT_953714 [Fibularhizoctonia sp. CBS 109695]
MLLQRYVLELPVPRDLHRLATRLSAFCHVYECYDALIEGRALEQKHLAQDFFVFLRNRPYAIPLVLLLWLSLSLLLAPACRVFEKRLGLCLMWVLRTARRSGREVDPPGRRLHGKSGKAGR